MAHTTHFQSSTNALFNPKQQIELVKMMFCRLVAASLFLAILSPAPPAAAQNRPDKHPGMSSFRPESSSDPFGDTGEFIRIVGTVRTLSGHSVSNASVQARDLQNGSQFFRATSDSSGSFALSNVPPGRYEVVASTGVNEAREEVLLAANTGEVRIELRIRGKGEGESIVSTGSTVSVADFRVPDKARSIYEKALQSYAHGKPEESRAKVEAALAIFPQFAQALILRGVLKENAGRPDEAIADFHQAIQCDPNSPYPYLALAGLFNSTGRFDESIPVLSKAERLAPDNWQVYFERSRVNLGRQEFSAAMRNLDHATELRSGLSKEVPEIHLARGFALIGLTEIPQAVQELETFLSIEPSGKLADRAHRILDQLRATTITASR